MRIIHMFKRSLPLAIPAVLAAIVLAVAACGGDDPEVATTAPKPAATGTTAPAPTAAQPTATTVPPAPSGPSGNVTIASTISPLIQNQRRDISAVGGIGRSLSVWETIVRAPFVAPPQPPPQDHTGYSPTDLGLASSWTIASDFTSITFDIRPDIPWHSNGGDWGNVTADDVAWSFNEAFATDSVNNGAEEIGAEMKLGFDVLGPLQVKQNITPGGFDPTWAWLQGNASFAGIVITNKAAFEQLGAEKYAETPIGTGKYQVLEWIGSEKIETEAVDGHWTGIVPYVKNITVVDMPDASTREAALRAGEIDAGTLPPQVINDVVDSIGGFVQEIGIARPQGFQMAGNYWGQACVDCEGGVMERPGFDEGVEKGFPWIGDPEDAESMESARKVRWAMAMAIDRESIIENVLEGLGRVVYAWQNILPDHPDHKDKWNIPFDPEMAKQYMTEAGYADGFDYEIWVPGDFAVGTVSAAVAVAEMWRQHLGINATIDRTNYGVRRPQTVEKTINVPFTHGINWIPGATSARYICPQPGHIVGFTMADDVCALGLSNATEQSLSQRIANNIEVQDYLSHWMLFIPMYQAPAVLYAVGPRIASYEPYNQQDVFFNRVESIQLK
jgi:ABC-type transport system substrate-binding protein